MNNEYLRENRWDVVDASDVIEVCDEILEQQAESCYPTPVSFSLKEIWAEGFIDAVKDLKHAAEQNGLTGFDLHLESWAYHVATTTDEYGYLAGIEAVQDEMSKLIRERSI